MKTKKCKICKNSFEPTRQLQPTCNSIECQMEYANKHLKSKQLKAKREASKALKVFNESDKTKLKKTAQRLINEYSRIRDERDRGRYCCTCKKYISGQADGGHFLPTSGYSAIRYNTNQIHLQCKSCNRFNGGMPKEYRVFMIEKYGLKYVENLEATRTINASYSVEYYQKLIRVVRKKIKALNERIK